MLPDTTHMKRGGGDHDDLVLAVATACWCGERYLTKLGERALEGVPVNVIGGHRS